MYVYGGFLRDVFLGKGADDLGECLSRKLARLKWLPMAPNSSLDYKHTLSSAPK